MDSLKSKNWNRCVLTSIFSRWPLTLGVLMNETTLPGLNLVLSMEMETRSGRCDTL